MRAASAALAVVLFLAATREVPNHAQEGVDIVLQVLELRQARVRDHHAPLVPGGGNLGRGDQLVTGRLRHDHRKLLVDQKLSQASA